jgi:hypothetical protein
MGRRPAADLLQINAFHFIGLQVLNPALNLSGRVWINLLFITHEFLLAN